MLVDVDGGGGDEGWLDDDPLLRVGRKPKLPLVRRFGNFANNDNSLIRNAHDGRVFFVDDVIFAQKGEFLDCFHSGRTHRRPG